MSTFVAPTARQSPSLGGRRFLGLGRLTAVVAVAALALGVVLLVWLSVVSHRNVRLSERLAQVEQVAHAQATALAGARATAAKANATVAHDLVSASVQISAIKQQLEQTKTIHVTPLTARLARTEKRLSHVTYCLPEITQDINGIGFAGYGQDGWLQDGYITNHYNISRFCSDILLGQQTNGEGE